MLCTGNASEYCGAGSRLDIYDFNKTVSLPPWTTTSDAGRASSTVTSDTVSTSTGDQITTATASTDIISTISTTASSGTPITTNAVPTGPANLDSVGPYVYLGCYTEGTSARALAAKAIADDAMTIETCEAYCASFTPAYTYFGTEYGRECKIFLRLHGNTNQNRLLRKQLLCRRCPHNGFSV